MELLADEEADGENMEDDGELEGSGDDFDKQKVDFKPTG